jgi:anthranilate synthase/aminodeoxychorismate synthase-like glutamine amidotransferase
VVSLPGAVRVLCVDNYDSFTWNLVAALERLGASVSVVAHDAASADALLGRGDDAIVLSPGPCTPTESFATLELARRAVAGAVPVPVLGVCLGHQALGVALGGALVRAERPIHGETRAIFHAGDGMFEGASQGFDAARYNSLVLERSSLPSELVVTAWTEDGEVMGVRHARYAVEGVQFHPESFLTTHGEALLGSWLGRVRRRAA